MNIWRSLSQATGSRLVGSVMFFPSPMTNLMGIETTSHDVSGLAELRPKWLTDASSSRIPIIQSFQSFQHHRVCSQHMPCHAQRHGSPASDEELFGTSTTADEKDIKKSLGNRGVSQAAMNSRAAKIDPYRDLIKLLGNC